MTGKKKRGTPKGWGIGHEIYSDDERTISIGVGVLENKKKNKKSK